MIDLSNIDLPRTYMLIAALTVGAGTILGATGRIVVFRDFRDLVVTFSGMAGWAVGSYFLIHIAGDRNQNEQTLAIGAIAVALLLLIGLIIRRSYQDNGAVLSTVLAVLTKLPYAIFVPLLAIQAIAPTGKTAATRASSRASALLILTILAPVLIALTRDKSAFTKLRDWRTI